MAGIPPVLPGWSEHVGPEGQMYWYNDSLQQSSNKRPTNQPAGFPAQYSSGGSMPIYTGPPPPHPSSDSYQASSSQIAPSTPVGQVVKPKTKKEKPAKKESIPGATGWLRVTTTLGNIFYTHVESKRSEWTIPDEIKDEVESMQDEEHRVKALEEEEERLAKEQEEEERRQVKEQERLQRLKEEEEERRKRQEELRVREEAVKRQRQERERIQEERLKILQEQNKRKREAEDGESNEKFERVEETDKRARLDEQDDVDDDEAWQREMAAEMAAEADLQDSPNGAAPPPSGPFNVPPPGHQAVSSRMELSAEEGKALFMHMLNSLTGTPDEINPMAPWDRELPKFIRQRDYTVLSSLRDRQDAFNEWCKVRIKEKRSKGLKQQAKPNSRKESTVIQAEGGADSGDGSNEANADALTLYRGLLQVEVKSTRTRWEDFRKSWKKDRRFFAFGRDEREREKVFRSWLKELGESECINSSFDDQSLLIRFQTLFFTFFNREAKSS